MNLLIDTHALLWFITNSNNLPSKTKNLIASKENNCFVSIASFWEITIKVSLKRLELNNSLEHLFKIIEESGFLVLPIQMNDILTLSTLAFHHYDPFDRIIIAQALQNKMILVSKDKQFKNYPIEVTWA